MGSYRQLVEHTVAQLDPMDVFVPIDVLEKVDSLGYSVPVFQDDVLDELEARKTLNDDRQPSFI